jgi:hypothetical protein
MPLPPECWDYRPASPHQAVLLILAGFTYDFEFLTSAAVGTKNGYASS